MLYGQLHSFMQTYHRLTICHFGFICHRVQLGLASTYTPDIRHPIQIYSAVAYCIIISIPKHPSSSIQVKLTILNLTIVILYCICALHWKSIYSSKSCSLRKFEVWTSKARFYCESALRPSKSKRKNNAKGWAQAKKSSAIIEMRVPRGVQGKLKGIMSYPVMLYLLWKNTYHPPTYSCYPVEEHNVSKLIKKAR